MKKILVVDDHPLIRRSMIMLIKDQYPEIVIFESGTECGALEIVHKENPDMVILDLELNQGEGLSVLQQMRHEGKATPVLVVSMHQKPDRINQALREGANGYIFKGDGAENLLAAIQSILDGDKYMSESIPSIVVQGLQAGKLSQDASPLPALSKREQEIFDLIGQSLTPKEVAYQLHISSHTIDTHIERILEKLHLASRHQLICMAVQERTKKQLR